MFLLLLDQVPFLGIDSCWQVLLDFQDDLELGLVQGPVGFDYGQ